MKRKLAFDANFASYIKYTHVYMYVCHRMVRRFTNYIQKERKREGIE